jgi:hypothetical protein
MAAYAEFRYVLTNIYQSGSTPNSVVAELPFTNVNFTQQLNSIGTFQGEVLLSGINSTSLNVYDGTVPGKMILWVLYADPVSLVFSPIWSGVVWSREYDSATQRLSITAQEMISLYQRRRITSTKTYVAQDPAYIARNLLQFTEGVTYGKTGLTYNSATTGLSTNRTYNAYEYKSVYQSIKDLASNFFDFKIKPYNSSGNLVNEFQIGYPLGTAYSASSKTAPIFQFPGNVVSYRFPEDGQSAANQLYGLGYGANNTKLIASAVDTSKYTDGFPLLQDTANYTDIADITLLRNTTLGQLNAISYPPTTIEVVIPIYVDPVYPLYQIGDYVRFDIKDDYFPSGISFGSNSDALRIVALSFNPGENGPSNVTLTLTRQLAAGSVS